MARRRREVAPDAETAADVAPPIEGPGPHATLTMRGSAADVKRQMGVGAEAKPEPEKKKETNGSDDEKQKFIEAIRNPRYLVRVKRQSPRTMAGHCWDAECPIAYTKLQDETKEGWGGGTFRATVVDPESNKTVTADHFEIPGEPISPELELTSEEQQKVFMQGGPKTASEMTVEGLNRRAEVTAKMLEVEHLESQLEDARKRREGVVKPAPQDNTRVDDLERRLREAQHQAELEARDRKHAEEIRQLRELIEKSSKPQKQEGPSETALILQQMQKSQEAADKRFEALQKQMQDDKLNAILDEVKRSKAGQGGSLLDQAEAMLKLKKLFGWGGDDEGDEDEADDPNDDRPWWERALDKLGGKLGDKLFDKFTNLEEKGEKVDREKFLAEMSQYADQAVAEATAKNAQRQVNRLPAPPAGPALPTPPLPLARPSVTVPPPQVTALPPPPPAPAGPEPAGPAVEAPPAPAQAAPKGFTIEQEIAIRVGGVLEMIEREMELRPHEYVWNYEGAYNSLPESVLERVCAAADPIAMFDAFVVPGITAEGIAEIKAKAAANPRILAWIKLGHDELKLWWAEKQKDPHYDPFANEEGEEE